MQQSGITRATTRGLAAALALSGLSVGAGAPALAATVGFEDVGANLPIADPITGDPELHDDGFSAVDAGQDPDFTSGGATFNNDFADFGGGCCFQGWAYSQETDTTTPGFANQFSAITGSGVGGSATYGVAFTSGAVGSQDGISTITLDDEAPVAGAWFTNTTFAALSMLNGDQFADPFGGPDGSEPDFFRLTVTGRDASDAVTGSVEVALADYTFENDALDFIVMDWTWVDLSPLGDVASLDFALASSDVSGGFLNTPSYFAMDDLVIVPEPGTGALLAFGLGVLARRRGRRRRAGRRGAAAALAAGALAVSGGAAQAGPFTDAGYDPVLMTAWASEVDEIVRGPVDIADPMGALASFGVATNALGAAVADPEHVVSLGDGGRLTLYFDSGIGDGPGDDFAVYENGFFTPGGLFAELAFVEVSSNGIDFARFPATSLQAAPVAGFDTVDPSDYDNLGGRHALFSGTGFDLTELAGHPLVVAGTLLLHDVRYVRLVDVTGDGSTVDASGNPVYDPYDTPFASGGFDAESVGVLHTAPEPGSLAMLAAGAALLPPLSRRRAPGNRCAHAG